MHAVEDGKAGWSVKDWCSATGFGVTKFYDLGEEEAPASIRIGARRIITEAPRAWLERMARQQQQAA